MRDPQSSSTSWASAGWICLLAFLALPNCSFDVSGLALPRNFEPGAAPLNSAIFCDIEEMTGRRCATDEDKAVGVRLAAAAVALNTGQTSVIGLDESPEARARCAGEPEAVTVHASFPEGLAVCLNCSVIGSTYANPDEACVVKCTDVVAPGATPPPPAVLAFCQTHAKASTNMVAAGSATCFAGACTDGGNPVDPFADKRREPESVSWRDLVGVVTLTGSDFSQNGLMRTAATTMLFDAGAASAQWITSGDAHVEFLAWEDNLSHVVGFSEIPAGCPFPCPDTDPSLADMNFAVSLNYDGRFYVIESGLLITGPGANGSFGTYAASERFRVTLRDNSDGTATVTYSRPVLPCASGQPCPQVVFYTSGVLAHYPLRVDASFREVGARTANVTLVRIR